jgi:aldose 1-epimerase
VHAAQQAGTRIAPTGRQLELSAGEYRAVVVQGGGGLRMLERAGRQLIDGYGAEERCEAGRGQLLVPWPNRVQDGRYRFDEETRQLAITEPERNCAIHGLVRWSSWEIAEHGAERLVLRQLLCAQPGYPHVLGLSITYTLHHQRGLEMALTATNLGANAAPYALGMHPYLTAGAATIDVCELTLPAERRLPADERGIPIGPAKPLEGTPLDFRRPREIGAAVIDSAFTALARDRRGRATVSLRDPRSERVTSLWVDESFPWIQVFSGDTLPVRRRQGLAVEPMSAPPNALVGGEDLIVLAAGESHTGRWGIFGM